MDSLVVKMDETLRIIGIDRRKTTGLAHQLALRVSDEGMRCRVIDPEDECYDDVVMLYGQLMEKRELGFIGEYGHIPNGTRNDGEGARTIGHMIYPAFGGLLESGAMGRPPSTEPVENTATPHSNGGGDSLTIILSSNGNEKMPKKFVEQNREFNIKIGGVQI